MPIAGTDNGSLLALASDHDDVEQRDHHFATTQQAACADPALNRPDPGFKPMPMYVPPDPIVARERLTVLMAEVESDMAQAQESAGTGEPDPSNVGRLSRMDALRQQASTQRLAVQRRRIVAALDRLDAGTYGRCCECGEAVESERMRCDAMILFCAECQAERDASL